MAHVCPVSRTEATELGDEAGHSVMGVPSVASVLSSACRGHHGVVGDIMALAWLGAGKMWTWLLPVMANICSKWNPGVVQSEVAPEWW